MPTGIIPNTDIELNLLSGAHWSRTTIADGKWLNSNTIQPLFNNDCILASAIHDTSADLYNRIEESSGYLQNEVDKINDEIDTINAGSDVIDVVGTYQQLLEYTGWTTDNDVIKVLNDESNLGNQTYYRYIDHTLDSGTLYPDSANWVYLGDLSPYYNKTTIDAMSAYLYNYTTTASGNLHQEIVNVSGDLHTEIVNSSSYLYRYINTASGNLFQKINNTSAFLNQEIESTSSYLNTYIETVSGNLYQDIYNTSSYLLGELVESATNLQDDIDYVSGQADYSAAYLYSLIHDTSGKTEVSGGTYVQVTKLPQKPDGMITYSADLYPDKIVDLEASGKHLTLVNSGNTSTFACDASKIIFGSGNDPEDIKFSDYQNAGTLTSAVSNDVILGVIPKEPGGTYNQLAFVSNKANGTQTYGWQETSGFVRADIDQSSVLSENEKKQVRDNIGIVQSDWEETNQSSLAYILNKPTISDKVFYAEYDIATVPEISSARNAGKVVFTLIPGTGYPTVAYLRQVTRNGAEANFASVVSDGSSVKTATVNSSGEWSNSNVNLATTSSTSLIQKLSYGASDPTRVGTLLIDRNDPEDYVIVKADNETQGYLVSGPYKGLLDSGVPGVGDSSTPIYIDSDGHFAAASITPGSQINIGQGGAHGPTYTPVDKMTFWTGRRVTIVYNGGSSTQEEGYLSPWQVPTADTTDAGKILGWTSNGASWFAIGRNLWLNQNSEIQTDIPGGHLALDRESTQTWTEVGTFASYAIVARYNTRATKSYVEVGIRFLSSGLTTHYTFVGTQTVGSGSTVNTKIRKYINTTVYYTATQIGDSLVDSGTSDNDIWILEGTMYTGPVFDFRCTIWFDSSDSKYHVAFTAVEVGKFGATNG